MLTFPEKLARSFRGSNAQLCVGLDPDLHRIPNDLRNAKRPIFEFNKRIVDSARNYCNIFKPQAAFYHAVAAEAEELWLDKQNVMLVVGATFPREMSLTRKAAPSVPFLVPGIGSQNGSLASSIRNGRSSVSPNSLIISASRSIIYSGGGTSHGIEEAARRLAGEIAGYEAG